MTYRVLVCGGRDYKNKQLVFEVLDDIHAESTIGMIIQGGAKGADLLAAQWTVEREIPCLRAPAEWKTHGKAAGAIRNTWMLLEGKPDLVIAFPGGPGTANMVKQAEYAGVKVLDLR